VEREYRAWRHSEEGERIFPEFVASAVRLFDRGWRHFSADAIWHHLRFSAAVVAGPDRFGFKLNNNHTAYLAREAMASDAFLTGFFETRTLRGRIQ
jgi:hypothetical protein